MFGLKLILETGNLKLADMLASRSIEFRVSSIKFLIVNAALSLTGLYDELIQNHCHKIYIIWTKELRKVIYIMNSLEKEHAFIYQSR